MQFAENVQRRPVARELRKALFPGTAARRLAGIASSWVLACAMCTSDASVGCAWRAAGWATLLTMLLLRGAATRTRTTIAPPSSRDANRSLSFQTFCVALTWGMSSFILLPGAGQERAVLLVVAVALVAMTGSTDRAAHPPGEALYMAVLATVFGCGLIVQPGGALRDVGLGFLFFGLVRALTVLAQASQIRRERQSNVDIAQLLDQTRAALDDAQRARVEAEAARALAERMSASRTRFLATASHDLRQPMHSIGLVAGILQDRTRDQPELARLTTMLLRTVDSMERLFGSLLDISKLDAGVVQPDVEPVHVGKLLARLEDAWRPLAAERGLRLRVRAAPLIVRSDTQLLERILGNLVSNALRYTPGGGVLVTCRRRQGGCAVQVWDTGVGIAPKNQAAIFDEFYRVAAPGCLDNDGLGLGLAVVQRSAQLLGHRMRLRSRPGRGSMFEIWMDGAIAAPPPRASTAIADPCDELVAAFVVIVDSHAPTREAMAEVFGSWGCRVLASADARTLRRDLAAHLRMPDLIIVDHRPEQGASDFELIAALRDENEQHIPALMLTATLSSRLAREAAARGVDLLQKPAGTSTLRGAVREALRAARGAPIPRRATCQGELRRPRAAGSRSSRAMSEDPSCASTLPSG